MRIWFIIYIVIAFNTCVFSQVSRLRYVAGYPNYNLTPDQTNDDWNVVYSSSILKQQGDSLVDVKPLSDSLNMLYYLRHYYNKNSISVLLAGKTNKFGSSLNGLFRLLTIDTKSLNTMSVEVPNTIDTLNEVYRFLEFRFYTLDIKEHIKYALVYSNFSATTNNNKTSYLYYTLDPVTGILQRSSSAYYQYVITNGGSLCPYLLYNGETLPLQSDPILNQLLIPSELDFDFVYKAPLPTDAKLSGNGAFLIIDDQMVRVLYLYESTESTITLHVYDKSENRWSKLILPSSGGNKILMKNFAGWLVGSLNVKSETAALKLRRNQPGQEVWSKARTKYSPSLYEILEAHEPLWYSEGTLYIYNINTKAYIQWDTNQADSEILLVEDNKVYYRKYDEIYEVPILKGKSLGKHRLVVKNKYVPAIHFMFTTKGK